MSRKQTAWSSAFIGVTAAAVGMEVAAVLLKNEDISPWCAYLVKHVPKPITYAATAVLVAWLPPHIIRVYKRAEKIDV